MFSKRLVLVALLGATTIAVGDNKKQEGGALLSRALEVSNIRVDGAPPFTLKATFDYASSLAILPDAVSFFSFGYLKKS